MTRNIYLFSPIALLSLATNVPISSVMCKQSLNCRGSLYSKQPRPSLGLDSGLSLPRLHLGLGGWHAPILGPYSLVPASCSVDSCFHRHRPEPVCIWGSGCVWPWCGSSWSFFFLPQGALTVWALFEELERRSSRDHGPPLPKE